MNWITAADYKAMVRDNHLAQLIDTDEVIIDTVEATAVQNVRDALHQWYDVDAIFATEEAERPAQVVRWCVILAVYYLYERIPDKLVPERIVKNYDRCLEMLNDISDGKLSVELPLKETEDGENITKFRWGGIAPRSH